MFLGLVRQAITISSNNQPRREGVEPWKGLGIRVGEPLSIVSNSRPQYGTGLGLCVTDRTKALAMGQGWTLSAQGPVTEDRQPL